MMPAAVTTTRGATLFHPFHVTDVAAFHAEPQASYVGGAVNERLGALAEYRQREVLIAAAGGIALGNVRGELAAAIEYRQLTVVDAAAVSRQVDGSMVKGGRGDRKAKANRTGHDDWQSDRGSKQELRQCRHERTLHGRT